MNNKYHLSITHNPKNISVLFIYGGNSIERDISIMSSKGIIKSLNQLSYDLKTFDLNFNHAQLIQELHNKPDVVFNGLHGKYGEDGTIQGLLNTLNIKYTHSGVLASALGMDKYLSRQLFQAAGIKVPYTLLTEWSNLINTHPIEKPYVIKPRDEGSSLGVYIIKDDAYPIGTLLDRWNFTNSIIVEKFIVGLELTVPVIGNKAFPSVSIHPYDGFNSYENKYTKNKAKHCVPALVPSYINTLAQEVALKAHKLLGCRGLSRSDFIFDPITEELFLLEINTQPGMNALSLVPESIKFAKVSYTNLCAWLIEEALYG